jgi:prevent-host-death family protein
MRTAGIREARQNLSALLEEVKKGREIVITDRGKPVARLVPPTRRTGKPFPDLSAFRASMPLLDPPLSQTIIEEREDSLY